MVALTIAWVGLLPLAALMVVLVFAFTLRPQRPGDLPSQSSDYLISIVEYEVMQVAAVVVLPMIALWIAWVVARRRHREPPT